MFVLKSTDARDADFRRCWEGILVICLSDYVSSIMNLKIDAEPHPNAKHARLRGDLVSMRMRLEKKKINRKFYMYLSIFFPQPGRANGSP